MAREIAQDLARLALQGPVPAVGHGPKAVGFTLMDALGMQHSVASKPRYKGMVLAARRGTKLKDVNRVNLFAKVPDWDVSACKSSAEIVERYGYQRDGGKKLYCSVVAGGVNTQGLFLEIDDTASLLRERHRSAGNEISEVAAWRIDTLRSRLQASHPESAWVLATSTFRDGLEYFHYRYVRFTGQPRSEQLVSLIKSRTVSLDHLIFAGPSGVVEKGPLFKIAPQNVSALFPASPTIDLMTL